MQQPKEEEKKLTDDIIIWGNYSKSTCGLAKIHFTYSWFEKCHFAYLSFAPLGLRNLPLLKIRVNMYFCPPFYVSLLPKHKKQTKVRNNKIKKKCHLKKW